MIMSMGAYRTKILIGIALIAASGLAYAASTGVSSLAQSGEQAGQAAETPEKERAISGAVDVNSPDPAIQAGFIPHKALYEIKLSSKKSGAQILNIHGQMLYEWTSNCEAWNSAHKFNLVYEYADSPPMQLSSDYSLYESFDGASLDYYSQRKSDGAVVEELRGTANMDVEGGEAVNRVPDALSFDLPQGTLFPMKHSLDVLQQMRNGKKFYNAVIFDGSDQEGPIAVNAFMGGTKKVPEALARNKTIDQSLLSDTAHYIRLAFFPLKNEASESDYEMSMLLHDNGVISDMEIDYSDFSVVQRLIALEKTKADCSPAASGRSK